MGDKNPIKVEAGQIKFAPHYKGAYLQEEFNDTRYYKDQAAQAGLSRLVGIQLQSQKVISSISVIQNDRSLEFRVLELDRRGRQGIANRSPARPSQPAVRPAEKEGPSSCR